jgi:hypothetical protein
MASVTPWRRSVRPSPNGQGQAAIYRERAAHLRTLVDAEADPILREQLRDIARQYDEIANSVMPVRRMLGAMRREIASHRTAELQTTDKSEKPTG